MTKVTMIVLNSFRNDARVYKEAETLAQAGYSVKILAIKDEDLPAKEKLSGFVVKRVTLNSRSLGLGIVARVIKLIEYIIKTLFLAIHTRADVYHAHDADTLGIAWIAAKVTSARLVYDSHEFEAGRGHGSNLPRIIDNSKIIPERLFIHHADVVITVSDAIANEISNMYKIPHPVVVRNCPKYQVVQKNNLIRQQLSIPDDNSIVLYQGGVGPGRGLHSLIAGSMNLPNVVVVILGDGLIKDFQDWVKENGWTSRVYFMGLIPWHDLLKYTASADVGVALIQNVGLSYYYSLPNKLFEYMQAGLPVIASNFPEIKTIVTSTNTGLVIDPESPDAFCEALVKILYNPQLKAKMQSNARKVSKIYNWENEEQKLLDIYHNFKN